MVDLLERNNSNIDFKNIEYEVETKLNKRKEKLNDYSKEVSEFQPEEIYSLEHLKYYSDIKISRKISSHRTIVGASLIKIRQILDDEIRRSLDPVIDKQIEFNKKLLDYLFVGIKKIIDDNQNRIEQLERIRSEHDIRIEQLEKQIKEQTQQVNFNIREIFKLKVS